VITQLSSSRVQLVQGQPFFATSHRTFRLRQCMQATAARDLIFDCRPVSVALRKFDGILTSVLRNEDYFTVDVWGRLFSYVMARGSVFQCKPPSERFRVRMIPRRGVDLSEASSHSARNRGIGPEATRAPRRVLFPDSHNYSLASKEQMRKSSWMGLRQSMSELKNSTLQ